MNKTNYFFICSLFLVNIIIGSEKKEPNEQEKAQWAADAEKWKRMTTALQGKMGKPEQEKTQILSTTSLSQNLHNQKAKL